MTQYLLICCVTNTSFFNPHITASPVCTRAYSTLYSVQYCHNGTAWELKLATPNTDSSVATCYTYLSGTENRRQSFFQTNYFRQFRDVWGFKKLPTFSRSCCYRAGHTKQRMRQLWHRQNMYMPHLGCQRVLVTVKLVDYFNGTVVGTIYLRFYSVKIGLTVPLVNVL